jgi:DNA-binding CsgD family transcriptional regulator
MTPLIVVEVHLLVNCCNDFRLSSESVAVVILVFERRPQRFRATVVPTDPGGTHRSAQAGISARLHHRPCSVLGGFNRSSQRLEFSEVRDGVWEAAVGGAWLSGATPVAGAADRGLAPGPGPVLGGHRGGCDDRGRRCRGGRVVTGRVPLVPHTGGVNPRLRETVSGRYLASNECEDIALWRAQGAGVREIARRQGRAASTISCELRRNASTRTYWLDYKASTAQWHAERRARRPKTAKLVANQRLRQYVQDKVAGVVRGPDGRVVAGPAAVRWTGRNKPHRGDRAWVTAWRPEQIAQRLKIEFPDDESMQISHEAIYQALYVQSRGALKRELVTCLRRGRALRVPRARTRQKHGPMSPRRR